MEQQLIGVGYYPQTTQPRLPASNREIVNRTIRFLIRLFVPIIKQLKRKKGSYESGIASDMIIKVFVIITTQKFSIKTTKIMYVLLSQKMQPDPSLLYFHCIVLKLTNAGFG